MAKQIGIIKLKGKIGDLSFYKTKDGHLSREKGGVDAERIKNDPAFERTRENGAVFGSAAKSGKLVRDNFDLSEQVSAEATSIRIQVMKLCFIRNTKQL